MSGDPRPKEFILRPSWKYFFFSYLFSVLAIPLAGAGIVALYYLRKKHGSFWYVIRDDMITAINEEYEQNVDLADIERVDLCQNRFRAMLGVGSLVLYTSTSDMQLIGMSDPGNVKAILEKAILNLKRREEAKPRVEKSEPVYQAGALEKINYLTGLWQQGLLSDQDYRREMEQVG